MSTWRLINRHTDGMPFWDLKLWRYENPTITRFEILLSKDSFVAVWSRSWLRMIRWSFWWNCSLTRQAQQVGMIIDQDDYWSSWLWRDPPYPACCRGFGKLESNKRIRFQTSEKNQPTKYSTWVINDQHTSFESSQDLTQNFHSPRPLLYHLLLTQYIVNCSQQKALYAHWPFQCSLSIRERNHHPIRRCRCRSNRRETHCIRCLPHRLSY